MSGWRLNRRPLKMIRSLNTDEPIWQTRKLSKEQVFDGMLYIYIYVYIYIYIYSYFVQKWFAENGTAFSRIRVACSHTTRWPTHALVRTQCGLSIAVRQKSIHSQSRLQIKPNSDVQVGRKKVNKQESTVYSRLQEFSGQSISMQRSIRERSWPELYT